MKTGRPARSRSARHRSTFHRTPKQVDLATLVREMRENAGFTQAELAKRAGTTQSVIARFEDWKYTSHTRALLERIAIACDVTLKFRAEKKPHLHLEVPLV